MPNKFKLLLLTGLILSSCTSVTLKQDLSDYKQEINELATQIKSNPNDAQAYRDLGVICVKTEMYEKGEQYLKKANALEPDDPQTRFYYGLALEFNFNKENAWQIYRTYPDVSRLSPYRRLMEGRYTLLGREIAEKEAQSLLQSEKDINADELHPNLIAVFPLKNQSSNSEYDNLGRGIGEMLITDLSQVPNLELVERIRLNALIEEMAMGQTGMVKEGSEAQFGKLLGAGKAVTGFFDVYGNDIRMNVELWDHQRSNKPRRANNSNSLEQLFIMEKRLVLGIVGSMGIELTPEQRREILYIPTKNIRAFMEYCNGLEKQDSGQLEAASQHFKRAVKIDPKFQASKNKVEETETAISMLQADEEQLIAMASQVESQTDLRQETINNTLLNGKYKVNKRLQSQSTNVGSTFIPGEDSRKTSEEAVGSETDLGDDIVINVLPQKSDILPDPPAPPIPGQ